ncbi:hypothetical protein NUU61_002802 [Penicillium alfredii]|uniref:Aminoglycoside phosphotransferase domain-containing protein n=1 Tax=Penicillium alfredii TaxID=1506179 RepID=A0A9W9FSX6_9EURO|nr:uncharacterized protein NUU61_002802 [Penicillium alfredii]KAJ5105455.1 hypothetical protein NUU61_002802 [Penicillium alfredii]
MLDRFFDCEFADCILPSVRGFGPCEKCNRHLCATHRRLPFHTCDDTVQSMNLLSIYSTPLNSDLTTKKPLPEEQFEVNIHAEVKDLRSKINEKALCERASELNGGHKCTIEHPPAWGRGCLMGCANYHAGVRFMDDASTVWLIRVPRLNGSIPQPLIDYLIRSEYATLKFLETTKVPAPRVFDYGIASDKSNKVGVSYLLIEQMPGQPWNMQGPHGKRFADEKDKERVWKDLADIMIELQHHPFPKAGSLLPGPTPSEPVVSAVASERFLVQSPVGPFDTAVDYYTSFVERNMALIADGQLFTSFPVNAYLVFAFLKSQVQALATTSPKPHSVDTTEQFYLKHVDDKGDHLMVDDELNIIGIIDWQMARVVPASEAFGPSLVTAEMGDIYDGMSSLTAHDQALACFLRAKGAEDLADIMGKDERLRRFFFGLDVDFPWEETLPLIRGIWTAFGIEKNTYWEVWKRDMLEKHAHDGRLKHIQDRFGPGP